MNRGELTAETSKLQLFISPSAKNTRHPPPQLQYAPHSHELRNEVVEELNSDLVSQSGANLDSKLVRGNKNSGMENEKGRRGEKSGERGQGDSLGEASLSEARG